LQVAEEKGRVASLTNQDEDEIDLEGDGEGDVDDCLGDQTNEENILREETVDNSVDAAAVATTNPFPNSKKGQLQERLRRLKMKINQSRQLNKKEVLNEGERLGSKEAHDRYLKQMKKQEKIRKEQEANQIHTKTIAGPEFGQKDMKAMMQSGIESIHSAYKKEAIAEKNVFSPKDYYNPEGQFRNYENSVKSIRPGNLNSVDNNPDGVNQEEVKQREREGAKRLASELKRRAQKAEKRKQKNIEFEGEDVSYINKRNKKFNEKISRNYDKHTAEIRQNLERGTAL
jgi:pre-mRNA-splicing factor SYF2